jgi:DNA-binding FadR family transcriptional regulator
MTSTSTLKELHVKLQPVSRLTSAQTVVGQLIELIRAGTLRPGDMLPSEKELVERLGVGRSTVREALQNLAALNVIEASAGHRTVVKSPTAAELFRSDLLGFLIGDSFASELVEARVMIEPDCVALAAQRASDADLDAIGELLDEHEAQHLANRSVAAFGAMFHIRLAEASRNRVAASFMTSILHVLKERGRRIDEIPHARKRELDEHREILALVRRRDPAAASELMRTHIHAWADTYS